MPNPTSTLKLTEAPALGASSARLSDSVYETLVARILAGKLAPGTVLSELALGRQFEISRTPIHDALVQLTKDGLIEQEANHRAVVAAFTSADVFDIFEMRKLLEGESARRAATKLDRIALVKLREAAEQMAATLGQTGVVERWVDCDEIFHTTIAVASGSKRLMQDITRYRMLHRSFNRMRTTPEVVRQALAEHMRILEALEKRDAKRASTEMVAHVHEWQAYFVNSFSR